MRCACGKRRILFTPFPARPAPPRAGEIEGEDYHFLSEADFRARESKRENSWSTRKVHEHYYGTLRKPIRRPICKTASMS